MFLLAFPVEFLFADSADVTFVAVFFDNFATWFVVVAFVEAKVLRRLLSRLRTLDDHRLDRRFQQPQLPPLDTWLRKGRALLLLDALNEMQIQQGSSYRDLVKEWKTFMQQAAREGNLLVFSCRTLDYGASL